MSSVKPDNGSDHRARTSDHPFQKHAQVGLRVHRIVIGRLVLDFVFSSSCLSRFVSPSNNSDVIPHITGR